MLPVWEPSGHHKALSYRKTKFLASQDGWGLGEVSHWFPIVCESQSSDYEDLLSSASTIPSLLPVYVVEDEHRLF